MVGNPEAGASLIGCLISGSSATLTLGFTSGLPVICKERGDDRILFAKVFPRLLCVKARASGCLPGKRRSGFGHRRRIQAVAAAAVLRLTARQRCSRMTIVTPYTPTMTAGMTTNR
jgi:hypothetical protein